MVSYQEEEVPESPLSPMNDVSETSPDGTYSRVSPKQFDEVLGRGSSTIVYRGLNNVLGNEVAWNVVNLEQIQDTERHSLFKEVQSNKQTEMFHLLVVYWNLSKHR